MLITIVYDQKADDFSFSRSRKAKATKESAARIFRTERTSPVKAPDVPPAEPVPAPVEASAPKELQKKKQKRRLPTTPEHEAEGKTVRRSKRLSNENAPEEQTSPHKAAHAQSHANQTRGGSPSPFRHRPITVEKKRKPVDGGVEHEKITRIQLPFTDTPVIKRNKEMRKTTAENGQRRSSSGMRGRRASSLIDEGRGNGKSNAGFQRQYSDLAFEKGCANDLTALPHAEVPTSEFYKHISADLTEPRRMRCLLGWCGTRALPPKPEAPKENTPTSNLEFQALQAGKH